MTTHAEKWRDQLDENATRELTFNPERVLFLGQGSSAVCWYRCALPAMFIGADWAGIGGDPPNLQLSTGLVKRETRLPNWSDYDIIVLQEPKGTRWLHTIRTLQQQGKKVLYEIDDYLHGIRNMPDHDFRKAFTKAHLAEYEKCMKVSDGIIASTAYIARRYRQFSRKTWVCENGIDMGRYNLERPERETVNLGWAGATGHAKAVGPWIAKAGNVMQRHEHTCFVSIGQSWANALTRYFGNRVISTPFTSIETYPAAMCMLDIALAPAGKGNFFRGKSDLRWVEAGALGIPTIADPVVYPHIRHGEDGFWAETPEQAEEIMEELVEDGDLRRRVGEAAQQRIRSERDMRVAVRQWRRVFEEVLEA